MQAEPCRHKPKENRTMKDKANSVVEQPNHPGLRGSSLEPRKRRRKGTTSPTLPYELPPSLHLITPGQTYSMGKTHHPRPTRSPSHMSILFWQKWMLKNTFKQHLEKFWSGKIHEKRIYLSQAGHVVMLSMSCKWLGASMWYRVQECTPQRCVGAQDLQMGEKPQQGVMENCPGCLSSLCEHKDTEASPGNQHLHLVCGLLLVCVFWGVLFGWVFFFQSALGNIFVVQWTQPS